ncbi:HIT-like domain-containing protein [Phascolomyces articulosus]|uniref:HIT-like domain-containing protein n=1 Tax=Phascolomyces articulosus TaxID=60185 RepID=A0AAD5K9E8_9FUNG|nr:HIT-like domain-containing protein [Phascolomyces articulosus]
MDQVIEQFQFERVLSHDPRTKLVYILGRIQDQHAIVSFEKARYSDSELPQLTTRTQRPLDDANENNIYGWGMANVRLDAADTHIKTIYPATELHIRKYEHQQRRMIVETPALYEQITYPYIKSVPAERIQWVINILNGTSEADRVIYRQGNIKDSKDKDEEEKKEEEEEDEFVILPDMKWDGTKESLYWVAIAMRDDILSLRSLNRTHLDLLKKIRDTAYRLAKERYDMDKDLLRLFIHYQPSYYHFHVHITAISFADAPGVVAGQAHLLDTVIDNIELYNDYYQRATLPFTIGERHPLFLAYQQQESSITTSHSS